MLDLSGLQVIHLERLPEAMYGYKLKLDSAKVQYIKQLKARLTINSNHFWWYIKGCGSELVGINEIIENNQVLS